MVGNFAVGAEEDSLVVGLAAVVALDLLLYRMEQGHYEAGSWSGSRGFGGMVAAVVLEMD